MKEQSNHIKITKVLTCIVCLVMAGGITGCKKSIDIGPPKTLINAANVYGSNGTAESVVSGLFAAMASSGHMYNGSSSITIDQGLAADEFTYYAGALSTITGTFYTNALSGINSYYWPEIYSEVFTCNSAIAGLNSPSAGSLTSGLQPLLLGEVKFARAFIYFNAVNLYGDVPLVLGTDPAVNSTISRSPAATVLQQVIKDLTDAQALLPDNSYVTLTGAASTTSFRIVPNKQAASALLARVYLYMQNWQNAENQASNVISSSSYLLEPLLSNVFLKASRETIWQLQSTSTTLGNADANVLLMVAAPSATANDFALSNNLLNAFETGDKRLTNWVGKITSGATTYSYAAKYKQNIVASATSITEYPIMFRLAEQYLIRAEARAQQNNISGAQSDLNAVRNRAGLANTTAATQADLLTAIYHERQIELFTEFGHRWFDLKRTGRLDAVMNVVSPQKGGAWSPFKALIPLPQTELIADPLLIQNPGY
jgi:hypothetical protein